MLHKTCESASVIAYSQISEMTES